MRGDADSGPSTGIVEGEMFGAPVPGEWPGAPPEAVKPTDGKPAEQQVQYEPPKKRWRLLRHRRRDDRPT